ncbi:putative membrane protein [Synechococcus sp. NOUM97013]|nr:putative membrane protein [Synechococcus sp. NOUM97013]
MVTGVIVHLIALIISVPQFIRLKAWDVVVMMMFLMSIGTGRLITARFL